MKINMECKKGRDVKSGCIVFKAKGTLSRKCCWQFFNDDIILSHEEKVAVSDHFLACHADESYKCDRERENVP